MTFRFNIKTSVEDLERGLPSMGDSFSPDLLSNSLVHLALAYRELKQIDDPYAKTAMKQIEKIFSRLIYRRAVLGTDIDETYLTRYGRINYENENPD